MGSLMQVSSFRLVLFSSALFFASSLAFSAEATPNSQETLAPVEASELREAFGLPANSSSDEVEQALAHEEIIADWVPIIRSYVETFAQAQFAGLFLDGGVLHVGFTSGTNLGSMRERLVSAIDSEYLDDHPDTLHLFSAAHSLDELEALEGEVTDDIPQLRTEGVDIVSVGADEEANRVAIGVVTRTPAVSATLEERYGASIIQVIEEQPLSPVSRFSDAPPMKGGLYIYDVVEGSTLVVECSSAFVAKKDGDSSNVGLITAGHCLIPKTDVEVWQHSSFILGPGVYRKFGGNIDGGVINITDNATNGFNELVMDSHLIYIDGSFYRRVTKVQQKEDDFKGEKSCRSGVTSGVDCGKIKNPSKTVLCGGKTLTKQRIVNFGSLGGDSGGSFYKPLVRDRTNSGKAMATGIASCANNTITTYPHIDYVNENTAWHVRKGS